MTSVLEGMEFINIWLFKYHVSIFEVGIYI